MRFVDPISLRYVFAERDQELRQYFGENKQKPKALREHIFFVVQSGRLQCLNGAYLPEFSDELASIVLGPDFSGSSAQAPLGPVSAMTGEQIAQIRARLGQAAFSNNVSHNYAHAKDLRGETSNGLCLCLFHDKAFELGLFTLTMDFRVVTDPRRISNSPWGQQHVAPFEGQLIRLGAIKPAVESLRNHWERIGFVPGTRRDV